MACDEFLVDAATAIAYDIERQAGSLARSGAGRETIVHVPSSTRAGCKDDYCVQFSGIGARDLVLRPGQRYRNRIEPQHHVSPALRRSAGNDDPEYSKRMPLTTNFQDGLSIFYYARYSFFVNENRYVPVIMNQDSISLRLNFNTSRREVDIDEADYPIASVYLDGYTDYQMVFGLTGEFSGLFSDDNARIPLKSKLRVKIGSVTVELKSWKRKNWSPPKY